MAAPSVFCVDIGTSSIKAGVIDSTGDLLWWAREALDTTTPDAFQNWQAASWLDALKALASRLDASLSIDAISISGNGPTLVPIGDSGVPVAPVLHWIDGREERLPDSQSFFLPKVRWFANNKADQFAATHCYLTCPEYIVYELTGEKASVIPSDEFARYQWDSQSLAAYGLDPGLFPEHLTTGNLIGRVSTRAAAVYGVPEATPVYAGGSDFLMALVGTAAVKPGRTCDRAGTSEGINHCSDVPVESPRLRTLPHAVAGYYNVAGILSSTGRIFEWFRRIAGYGETAYEEMLADVTSVTHQASRPLFLPSLHVGATWEFAGAAFMHLEPQHGPGELGRAVVESIGFAVRDLVETLEESGCFIESLRVSGGQARSAIWNQMKADITGKRVLAPAIVDAELTGNAAAALTGSGHFSSLTEAAEALVAFPKEFEPRETEHKRFSESYHEFLDACGRVVGILSDYL